MEFVDEVVLPVPPPRVWEVLLDLGRVAACVPGAEQVEEVTPLSRYRAVMKQRLGPFRLEVPVDITVEEMVAGERLRATAAGRDRITGATLSATLGVVLASHEDAGSRLRVVTDLRITGRLATLGQAVVRRRAQETFEEFTRRLRAVLAAG